MRLLLVYQHYHQYYVGALLKRAAKALGIDVTSAGPCGGPWLAAAPDEENWKPDIVVSGGAVDVADVERVRGQHFDAIVCIHQGDGMFVRGVDRNTPLAYVFTEGNEGEYEVASRADAVWSLMPRKPAGRKVPGLLRLEWGYDSEMVRRARTGSTPQKIDVSFRGSPSAQRDAIAAAVVAAGYTIDYGPPVSRLDWYRSLWRADYAICDHDTAFVSGRVVDAMALGSVVIAKPSPEMDVLAPRAYIPVYGCAHVQGLRPEMAVVAIDDMEGHRMAPPCGGDDPLVDLIERASLIALPLSWDSQLLRILGSIGVRP